MRWSIAFVRSALVSAAVGCSSSTTGSSPTGAFAGTYAATYVGVYKFTSPANESQMQNTESGTFVISTPTATTIDVEATFTGAGGVTGVCEGTATVNGSIAESDPADQACTYAVTGGTQTNVGSSAFALSGNTITDVLEGNFTGSNASGDYGGTFTGTWTLTRQN